MRLLTNIMYGHTAKIIGLNYDLTYRYYLAMHKDKDNISECRDDYSFRVKSL